MDTYDEPAHDEGADAWDGADAAEVEIARPLDKVVAVRLPPERFEALRREANDLGVGPATLARMWIMERLRDLRPARPGPPPRPPGPGPRPPRADFSPRRSSPRPPDDERPPRRFDQDRPPPRGRPARPAPAPPSGGRVGPPDRRGRPKFSGPPPGRPPRADRPRRREQQ